MILYFLRHASAGEHVANPKKDDMRALDKEGIEQCGYVGRALTALAGLADFRRLLEKYAHLEAILVVGHNPNLSQFLGAVISDPGCEASFDLKKGAVAKVEMRRTSGTLQWCLTPKVLRLLYETAVESSRPKTSRK
jgi:phosphohistidine phosphatase